MSFNYAFFLGDLKRVLLLVLTVESTLFFSTVKGTLQCQVYQTRLAFTGVLCDTGQEDEGSLASVMDAMSTLL